MALTTADLESVTTAKSVCRIDPDSGVPEPLWQDRRIAWPALTALLLPGRNLDAAPGLAKRLARVAEARLLAEFARPVAQREWRPIGMPLSPATLEGPVFARFADALPAGRHQETTVAIRPGDILADPGLPARLRPMLQARGFRFALDDAAPGLFALLPPERLGMDLIRLRWSPDLPGAEPPALAALLAEAPDRVALTGVDRPAAIAWGWEVGLRLFQGPLVERRRGGV
jgi:EAL domain-containing protein (putative c-di-GMP-specific phosphodiesterase class I)